MAKNQKGFTLIEILIVVAILAGVTLIGISSYMSSGKSLNFEKTYEEVQNILSEARMNSLSARSFYVDPEDELKHFVLEIEPQNILLYSESTAEFNYMLDRPEDPLDKGDYLTKNLSSENLATTQVIVRNSQGEPFGNKVLFVYEKQNRQIKIFRSNGEEVSEIPQEDNQFVILDIQTQDGRRKFLICFLNSGTFHELSQDDLTNLGFGNQN